MLEIKDYTEGDYEKYVQSITRENMRQLFLENFGGWSDDVSKEKFFKVVSNGYVKLFFLDGLFVGYVTFNVEKNDDSSYLINDIHIAKEFQRKGYGTDILNFVISKCLELGAKQLKIFVFKVNPAIYFYVKHGFKEIEYLERSKTCVMVKVL